MLKRVCFVVRFDFIENCKHIDSLNIIIPEEIPDAEENFFLADELETAIVENNKQYSGLKLFNKTRWGSHLMMSRSQHQNNGNVILFTSFLRIMLSCFHSLAIVKKVLVKGGYYDLLLSNDELDLLEHFVELLEVFEVFTKFVQREFYPTLNSVVLFRTEIVNRYLKCVSHCS